MSDLIIVDFNMIPEMFHESRLFKSRNQMKNSDQIILFENVCNFELKMNNYIEVCRALETLRYWNFTKTPECFYTSVLAKRSIIRDIILKNDHDMLLLFQTLRPFAELCVLTISETSEMRQVAENLGLVDLLRFIDA
jgi:hypothetical protein